MYRYCPISKMLSETKNMQIVYMLLLFKFLIFFFKQRMHVYIIAYVFNASGKSPQHMHILSQGRRAWNTLQMLPIRKPKILILKIKVSTHSSLRSVSPTPSSFSQGQPVLPGSCVFLETFYPNVSKCKHSSKPTPFNILAMSCTQHAAPCFFNLTASLESVSLLALIALLFHLEGIGGDGSCNGVLSRP